MDRIKLSVYEVKIAWLTCGVRIDKEFSRSDCRQA